ncbi:hypothetical protein MW887_006536 [Aspergillus wentii]|nr:hypothetical protein MW887_006536 [Aspergillus wentii]
MHLNFLKVVLLGLILPFAVGQQFQYATGKSDGSCDGKIPAINDWIEDARELSNAFMHAIDNVGTSIVAQKLFSSWFRLKFEKKGDVMEPGDSSKDSWNRLTTIAKEVHKFLVLDQPYKGMQGGPKVFCDDNFVQELDWDKVVLDDNEQPVMYQGHPLKLSEQYANVERDLEGYVPWYAWGKKGYFFAAVENGGAFCDSTTLGVSIAGYRAREEFDYPIPPSDLIFNDIIIFCPELFDNRMKLVPKLKDIWYIDPSEYCEPVSISTVLPWSGTLYHEMFHTASGHVNMDPSNKFKDPRGWHVTDWEYDPRMAQDLIREDTVENAETYVLFALSYWYYRKNWNDPSLKPVTFYDSFAGFWDA